MKTTTQKLTALAVTAFSLAFLGTSTFSMEVNLNPVGQYTEIKIYKQSTQDKAHCEHSSGIYKKGVCILTQASTVTVQKNDQEELLVSVETKAYDGKECTFDGKLEAKNQVQYVSQTDECEIELRYTSTRSVSVVTNGQCHRACSSGASSLFVDNAVK